MEAGLSTRLYAGLRSGAVDRLTEFAWPRPAVEAPGPWVEAGVSPAYTYTCAGVTTTILASQAVIGSNLNMTGLSSLTAGSSDKDLPGILQVLTPPFDHVFLTRYSHSPRAVPVETLAGILRQVSRVPFTLCPTPVEAWQAAGDAAGPDDLICITGSVFLAGELRPVVLGRGTT